MFIQRAEGILTFIYSYSLKNIFLKYREHPIKPLQDEDYCLE